MTQGIYYSKKRNQLLIVHSLFITSLIEVESGNKYLLAELGGTKFLEDLEYVGEL